MENKFDTRTKLLLGDKFDELMTFNFVVCGIGGVGSVIPISLVRSGVKNITLIDFDEVDESNLNRQLAYNKNDVGLKKVDSLKRSLDNLRSNLNIKTLPNKIDKDFNFSVLDDADYVFDCIDDIDGKILLIKYCLNHNIKIISSMGMGNRIDPTKIKIAKLNQTHDDPLAKKIRYELKSNNIDISKLEVTFSEEKPIIKSKDISSVFFVPNSAGIIMASHALKILLNLGE